jgi:predicted enzyme related to lactoylglutathione lyase
MKSDTHNIVHFEIPSDNVERLKEFYSSIFGWQFKKGQTEGYWIIENAGISGALLQKEEPKQIPTIFAEVNDIDEHTKKAEQIGAKKVKDKQEIQEGFFLVMEDPDGNRFGFWQNK